METEPDVHTLASLGECRRQLGLDERDDSLTLFLLIAATYTVENHCRRCLLRKDIREYFDSTGDNALFLREYPVRDVLGVHEDQNHRFMESSLIDPEHYYCTPEISIPEDTIHTLTLIPPYRLQKGTKTIKITYSAGYDLAEVPMDLKQAVLDALRRLLTVRNRAELDGRFVNNTMR